MTAERKKKFPSMMKKMTVQRGDDAAVAKMKAWRRSAPFDKRLKG